MLRNIIKRSIPRPIIKTVRFIIYFTRDTINLLSGKRDPLIPPIRLMFDGPRTMAAFKKNGEEFLQYFTDLCGLKSNEKILDVGSGIGRKALPLTQYLDDNGRYEGIDIVKTGIDWCKKHLSTRYPHFNFQLIDVFNKSYNPKGRYSASEYKFPFGDGSFDFVFLGSVFTHMLPEDLENYLSEIARVLKTGGRCLISFFLLNEESAGLIKTNKSTLNFKYQMGQFLTTDANTPEEAVCYSEHFILGLYDKHKLRVNGDIHYGNWCERTKYLSYQDIVIATKL